MKTSLFFLIPLYSLMISFITLMLATWYLRVQKKNFFEQIAAMLLGKVDSVFLDLEAGREIESKIDERLNGIIIGFKKQIPMLSMFLSQSKEDELKQMAKIELMKLIPDFKQKMVHKATEVFNHPINGQLSFQMSQLMEQLCRQVKYRLVLIVGGVGLLLGLVELGLIYLLYV